MRTESGAQLRELLLTLMKYDLVRPERVIQELEKTRTPFAISAGENFWDWLMAVVEPVPHFTPEATDFGARAAVLRRLGQ